MKHFFSSLSPTARGICCILLSALGFALMNVFVKLAGDLPSVQKAFFRNVVAAVVAGWMLWRSKLPTRYWQRSNLPLLILRASLGTAGLLCNYYAVDHLILSDASIINKLTPFFVIIFSALFLRERADHIQKLGVAAAFCGCLFIVHPSLDFSAVFPSIIGLLGACFSGAAYTCVRGLTQRGEPGAAIVLFFSLFSCLAVLPWIAFHYVPMTLEQLGILILAGCAASVGQFGVTAAYGFAPAKEISVFDYSQVLFSAFLGFFIFDQLPDGWSLVGYVIIIGTAVLLFRHNLRQTGTAQ